MKLPCDWAELDSLPASPLVPSMEGNPIDAAIPQREEMPCEGEATVNRTTTFLEILLRALAAWSA